MARDLQDLYYEHTITELRRDLEEMKTAARQICDGFSFRRKSLLMRQGGDPEENFAALSALAALSRLSGWHLTRGECKIHKPELSPLAGT